jgi:hypothetical protein
MYNYDGYYPYTMTPHDDSWMPYDLLNRPRPFVPKQLSKEARIALKRKRKQVKISRKKNR